MAPVQRRLGSIASFGQWARIEGRPGSTFQLPYSPRSACWRPIGIDQRGHGHSPDGPWPLSYQMMADDTAAIIEQLGLGPVDTVGHSDGTDLALLLARDHPQLVRRLVISGANLRSGLSPEEIQRRSQWKPEQLTQKLKALADSLPPWFHTDYAKVSPDGPDHSMKLMAKCYRMWIEPIVIEPADLKKVAIPVLVMAGDHDFTSIEENAEIYRGLPRGQLIIVPGSTHGTFRKRPDLVNLAIREFLDKKATTLRTRWVVGFRSLGRHARTSSLQLLPNSVQ